MNILGEETDGVVLSIYQDTALRACDWVIACPIVDGKAITCEECPAQEEAGLLLHREATEWWKEK